jgi:hypothetical protein
MKKSKINHLTFFVFITTGLILGLGVWLLAGPATSGARPPAPEAAGSGDQGKAEVPVTDFDWGTIDYGGGDATAEFTIKNSGSGPLTLSQVSTYCMCTTAQDIIGDQNSPYFGMHQKSSWIGQIPAGGQAVLKVVFDPAFHGSQGVGPVTRQIVMTTTDSQNPKLEFNLKGNVVK